MSTMTCHLLCKKVLGRFALTHSRFGHTGETGEETFLCVFFIRIRSVFREVLLIKI